MNDEAKPEGRRPLLVARGWVQVTALVFLTGSFVLGLLGYRVYAESPPVPEEVVDPRGHVVFTGGDVRAGQAVFLRNGLVSYSSVLGHGAYLGPDFTCTNNWPPEPRVANHPTAAMLVWSMLSLVALLGGIGLREVERSARVARPRGAAARVPREGGAHARAARDGVVLPRH
jgi:nitric oxide reductase large subunit